MRELRAPQVKTHSHHTLHYSYRFEKMSTWKGGDPRGFFCDFASKGGQYVWVHALTKPEALRKAKSHWLAMLNKPESPRA